MSNPDSNIKGRYMALNALAHSPGWEVFCERHKQVMESSIDAKIFDPETPAPEREILVRARQFLVNNHGPETVLKTLLVSLEGEVARAEREKAKTG